MVIGDSMKNILLDSADSFLTKFPLSTVGSVAMAFNWHILEPVLFQLGMVLVDVLRQKYIKKERQKALKEAREIVSDGKHLEK